MQVTDLRIQGKHKEAYQLLVDNPEPNQEWYNYEMMIIGYYVGELEQARRAIDRLMLSRSKYFNEAQNNCKWYLHHLKGDRIDFSHETLSLLAYETEPGNPTQTSYFTSNPSIVKTETGYLANIRYVNYLVIDGRYHSTSPHGQIKTKNVLVELDKEFKELRRAVVDDSARSKYSCYITGIEDIRLSPGSTFERAEFIGTVCDYWPLYNNMPRMIKGIMEYGKIIQSYLPAIPNLSRAEKNWIPIEDDNRYLYSFHKQDGETHLQLVIPNPSHFTVELISLGQGINLDWIRGSSQLIKYKEGYISIIHHVAADGELRRYLHRWLMWDKGLMLTHMSHPFIMADSLIQYIPGLCLDHDLKHFIISMSVQDRTAQLRRISCSEVEELLIPISELYLNLKLDQP